MSIVSSLVLRRQKRPVHLKTPAFSLCAALMLTGCALNGADTANFSDTDSLITNSVAKPVKTKGVAETDAQIIKSTVAEIPSGELVQPLAWSNPETGSSGAITAIDRFTGKHGQHCRGFKTSVASFAGVELYNGEACEVDSGEWVLSWFRPVDGPR